MSSPPRRVCIVKPSSLGDVVHALPTLAALRRLWPSAHLAWVVNAGLVGLLEGHPDLDEVIPFDRSRAGLGPRGLASASRFLVGLRRRHFDLAIDLQGLLRSSMMTLATGARVRVGFADAREGAARFYTSRVSTTASHAVDRLLAVARHLGAPEAPARFVAAMTDEDRRWARSTLGALGRPSLVVNLGARWTTKRWPPARFAEVARRALARGMAIVAVGAPEDRPLVDALRAALAPAEVLDLCGRTSLPRLAALAAEADVFLSNDTGPLHLAVAAGGNVVGIYTCTRPELTGPYGGTSVASKIWCAGSCVKRCDRMECMVELGADRVWDAVAGSLGVRMVVLSS